MITGSQELIRDINTNLVLESIVNSGPISRASIAKKLGLTKATVSTIVQLLLDKKMILEIGSDETSKGRKPILLSFNQKGGYVISIDLGVERITVLLTDLKGENCYLKQYSNDTSIHVLTLLHNIITETIEKTVPTDHHVVGIAIGIHGVVYQNHVIFTPYYQLSHLDLAKELEQKFSIPVFIENEANLSVIGEKTFCYDYPNIINISVHTGVGLGLYINNTLYTGHDGYAGEFGHTIIVPDGRPCPCGNHGCLEQYVSERALLKEFAISKNLPQIDFDTLVSSYNKHDPDALMILEKFVKYISIGINNILNCFNPDLIVINSSFTIFFPHLIEEIEGALHNRMNQNSVICSSTLQDTAILLGGACICINHFLGINFIHVKNESNEHN